MRPFAVCILLMIAALPWRAVADETIDQLKARVETAKPDDRIGLCLQVAQQQVRNADKFFTDGNVDQAYAALQDVTTYSDRAHDGASQSKKHLKNVEISVRKMAERLRDIKRTLAFDDQPTVEKAIEHLEATRTALLKEMFSKEKK